MSIELSVQAQVSAQLPAAESTNPSMTATGGPSQFDIAAFRQALVSPAAAATPPQLGATETGTPAGQMPSGSGFRSVIGMLENLNGDVRNINAEIAPFMDGTRDMSPSDMIKLTVRCHEFLFHSQLTANAANRTSDGVQQLFRQQS